MSCSRLPNRQSRELYDSFSPANNQRASATIFPSDRAITSLLSQNKAVFERALRFVPTRRAAMNVAEQQIRFGAFRFAGYRAVKPPSRHRRRCFCKACGLARVKPGPCSVARRSASLAFFFLIRTTLTKSLRVAVAASRTGRRQPSRFFQPEFLA